MFLQAGSTLSDVLLSWRCGMRLRIGLRTISLGTSRVWKWCTVGRIEICMAPISKQNTHTCTAGQIQTKIQHTNTYYLTIHAGQLGSLLRALTSTANLQRRKLRVWKYPCVSCIKPKWAIWDESKIVFTFFFHYQICCLIHGDFSARLQVLIFFILGNSNSRQKFIWVVG